MKTDIELRHDVEAELEWDPAVKAAAIGISVRDGVVTVSGHVDSYAEKVEAEKVVRRVAGVRAIALELDVRLSPEHRRSDTDIATTIEQALTWIAGVPTERLRVTVDGGWVTLAGAVDWDYQRRAVESAVWPLLGVLGVSNNIAVQPSAVPGDLQHRISEALKRRAEREAKQIQVSVKGNVVTLKGTVDSWRDREDAQNTAWSAPGVSMVINDLEIA